MKKLISAFLLLFSVSVFAQDEMPLDYEIFERDCYVEVLKDIYVLHSTNMVQVGLISLTTNKIDRTQHRRLAEGRILRVRNHSEREILFRDPAIKKMCLVSQQGICLKISSMFKSEIELFSEGMLKMVCEDKGTSDM